MGSTPAGFEGAPRGFLLPRGWRSEVDGRFRDVSRKNVRGDSDSPRHDLIPLSHLEHHEVDGDEVVSDLHGYIFGNAQGIANEVISQLQTYTRRLYW
jgi:hypothetical protein